jgi:hypothetical protein
VGLSRQCDPALLRAIDIIPGNPPPSNAPGNVKPWCRDQRMVRSLQPTTPRHNRSGRLVHVQTGAPLPCSRPAPRSPGPQAMCVADAEERASRGQPDT